MHDSGMKKAMLDNGLRKTMSNSINPKYEILNTKQYQNSKYKCFKLGIWTIETKI
jgi:hypothetical protein